MVRERIVPAIAVLALAAFFLSLSIHRRFRRPYPPITQLIWDVSEEFSNRVSYERPLGGEGGFRDLGGLLMGMRRMTADIAWISVLQYYGSGDMVHQGSASAPKGRHPALRRLVLRVIRLDPYFHFAYLYGAGSLAFNLERYDEALELLQEGILYNPTYWRFRLYVGAIIWKQKGKSDKMIPLLEEAILYPDCPTMVKSVLANIYKARGNYRRALEIWISVLEQEKLDETYRVQAEQQIADLKKKLGIK